MPKRKPGCIVRFWLLTRQESPIHYGGDSCWEWLGSKSDRGYPVFWNGEKNVRAHRFSYELANGQISCGLTLDHLCRNRGCVNPKHLEEVTQGVNTLRGNGTGALNARKTHCPQGHPYSPENTKIQRKGWRVCRTCDRASKRIGPRIEPPKERKHAKDC